jgi:hypothetical protein
MARCCEMHCRRTTSGPGPDDQNIAGPIHSVAHTLRMSASLVARCFSSSAMNLSSVF